MKEIFRRQIEDNVKFCPKYLEILELAQVSIYSKCTCNDCLCCACVEYLNETKSDFSTIREVRLACEKIGSHWFDPENFRFFSTRIESELIQNRFFITSEHFELPQIYDRGYTIRFVQFDGAVESLYDICSFETKEEAQETLDRLARGLN
jgi:hypothetical protein